MSANPNPKRKSSRSGNLPHKDVEPAEEVISQQILVAERRHSGPLPLPETLEAYERACPGSAMRIVAQMEQEAEHRRRIESSALAAEQDETNHRYRDSRRGQFCAVFITVSLAAIGGVLIYLGKGWPASLLGISGVGGIVATFVRGRWYQASADGEVREKQ